jgi:S1-C subfamily serine protease
VYEYTYGTGVLVNGEGRIVTAFHLVRDRKRSLAGIEEVAIFLRASRSYVPVDVIAEDPISDIAVLRASPRALPYGKFFSIAKGRPLPKVGERSYVIGLRADASEDSFEVGIVGGTFIDAGSRLEELARGKKLGPGPWITVSQMILFGYSGGAIIDGSGELIGIVVGAPELKGKWAEFSYGSGVDAVLRLFAEKEEK